MYIIWFQGITIMKTILNENGLVTHNTGRSNTLDIQATTLRAEEIYHGDENLVVLIQNLTGKVHSLFDKVFALSNEVSGLKAQIKESTSDFASYKDLEKLETRLDKELKVIEKLSKAQESKTTSKTQSKAAAKEIDQEVVKAKQ